MDKSWMNLTDRTEAAYTNGVLNFFSFAYKNKPTSATICCPCRKCVNRYSLGYEVVRVHLYVNGFCSNYVNWVHHGEPYEPGECSSTGGGLHNMGDMVNDVFRHCNEHSEFGDSNGVGAEDSNVGPDEETKKYLKLLSDAERELYPGCKDYTSLSFTVELLQLKVLCGWSDKSFDMTLNLIKKAFPLCEGLPASFYAAKKFNDVLGFNYQKIDACKNDCMLYYKENENKEKCDICHAPRYKNSNVESDGVTKFAKVPEKQMRYFPLKSRLQRLFMSPKTASAMRWHAEERVDDGVLRHPADTLVWKDFDSVHKDFGDDCRNVRLGLATDGFNPYRTMNISYSVWPVVLMIYNLPPWLATKQPFFILSILIDGSRAPGNDLDVYLRPLIDELKEFWGVGVRTYDAVTDKMFQLQAAILWTISDFPAFANLSGWSTKGRWACPACLNNTDSCWLKHGRKFCYLGHRRFLSENHKFRKDKNSFDGTVEKRQRPPVLSGREIFDQVKHIENKFGKTPEPDETVNRPSRKRKTISTSEVSETTEYYNWKKKSILFELPYWIDNLVRHNLDVMHNEKNYMESILYTILGVPGKTKDNTNSRLDLKEKGLRKELHPDKDGKHATASFTMTKKGKKLFMKVLADVKVPGGYSSNISRHVREGKIFGLKSHDYHILMQQLLPIAVRRVLPKDVVQVLIELSSYFRKLCSKSMDPFEFSELEEQIIKITCQLEKIFPPSFFDIMTHLPIHLAEQARVAGPVFYRWMYTVERYLLTLKLYVRNRAHPEGSIAEGYLVEECLTFCSRYLNDVETKLNRPERNFDGVNSAGRALGRGKQVMLSNIEWEQAHRYVLANSSSIDHFRE